MKSIGSQPSGGLAGAAAPDRSASGVEPAFDWLAIAAIALGFAALYGPTFWDLSFGIWKDSSHGQEPIILAIAVWLLSRKGAVLAALPAPVSRVGGGVLLGLGLLLYALGRTQEVLRADTGSMLVVAAAIVVCLKSWRGLAVIWFPLLFLVFAMPLPNEFVLALTAPLKSAVSASAVWLLSALGYPAGRAGVVMTVGQYELLVTEACAGLQTMFTLEAVGLLYANVMNYRSALRNGLLAVLVIPVSFIANVVRVMVLALVTYHLGDAAGRGFLHGLAGVMLFAVALAMLVGVDRILGALLPRRHRA